MSFGFGDIAKAIEICAWIWAHCFRDSRAADHRYRQFGREIQQLQPALQGLWAVVQEARGEVDPFERESKDIAGDFVRTLEACRDLLDRHVELKKNRAGVIENVIWNLHVQEQVDELCDQLRFHTQTLQLVAASHGTQLLLEIRREVAWLVEAQVWPGAARQEAQAPALELVPAWLDSVFGANAALAPPVPFEGLDNIPFRQGCEALRQHFGRLSREDGARESRAEFILEYLSLLKCHWIIRVLREAKDLDLRHPAYPLRRFISNVDLEVLQRIRSRTRCGVVPVTDDELRAAHGQSNEPFLIWEPPKERPQRRPWMKEHGEEKLRAVPLTGGEKLLFFKKSPTTMRIVPVVETDGEPRLSQYHGEMNLNVRTDSFVPLYAVDDQRDAPAVEIYRKDEERPVKFQLDDIKAAWGIQGVITGYQVRDDDDRVTWSMLRPAFNGLSLSLTARTVEMTGRIQVWQWKPQSEDSAAHVEARSMSASSGSGVSMESLGSEPASLLSRLSTGRTVPSIPESQSSRLFTDTELPQGSHRQLQPPVPPALVFFARSGRTYTYFHLEMRRGLFVDPTSCHCSEAGGNCTLMVIVPHSKRLTVRRVSADGGSLERWNLALFGGPEHPASYHDKKIVEQMDCEHLTLEFRTPQSRQDFAERLGIYMRRYDRALDDYHRLDQRAQHLADRPRKTTTFEGGVYGLSARSRPSMAAVNLSSVSGTLSADRAPLIPTMSLAPPIQWPFDGRCACRSGGQGGAPCTNCRRRSGV